MAVVDGQIKFKRISCLPECLLDNFETEYLAVKVLADLVVGTYDGSVVNGEKRVRGGRSDGVESFR